MFSTAARLVLAITGEVVSSKDTDHPALQALHELEPYLETPLCFAPAAVEDNTQSQTQTNAGPFLGKLKAPNLRVIGLLKCGHILQFGTTDTDKRSGHR